MKRFIIFVIVLMGISVFFAGCFMDKVADKIFGVEDATPKTETPTGQTSSQTPPATTGSISGTVTKSGGGAISGATVSIGIKSTTTDSNGLYTLSGVAAGTYTLSVSKEGYNYYSASVTVTAGSTTTANVKLTASAGGDKSPVISSGTVTDMVTDQTYTGTTFTLIQGRQYRIAMSISDPDGDIGSKITGYLNWEITTYVPPGEPTTGSSSISLYDDGTNGDVTVGDHVYSSFMAESVEEGDWTEVDTLYVKDNAGNSSNTLTITCTYNRP